MKTEIMTNVEVQQKALKIARLIQSNNKEWSASESEDGYAHVILTHKTGAVATIDFPNHVLKGARFVGTNWIRGQNHFATGPRLEVGANVEGEPERIARDFERRLLPGVLEKWKTHLEGKAKHDATMTRQKADMQRIAEALSKPIPTDDRKEFNLFNGDLYGYVRMNHETVDFSIRSVPMDLALKIAALVKDTRKTKGRG